MVIKKHHQILCILIFFLNYKLIKIAAEQFKLNAELMKKIVVSVDIFCLIRLFPDLQKKNFLPVRKIINEISVIMKKCLSVALRKY